MEVDYFLNPLDSEKNYDKRSKNINEKIKNITSGVFSFEYKGKLYKLRYKRDNVLHMRCSGRKCPVTLTKENDDVKVSGTHSSKCVHSNDLKPREVLSEIYELKSGVDGVKHLHLNHKRLISEMFMKKFFTEKDYPAPVRQIHLKFVLNGVYNDESYRIMIQNINHLPNSAAIFQENEKFVYLYLLCSYGKNGGIKLLIEIKNLAVRVKKKLFLESISKELNCYYEKNGFVKATKEEENEFKKLKKRELNTTLMLFNNNI